MGAASSSSVDLRPEEVDVLQEESQCELILYLSVDIIMGRKLFFLVCLCRVVVIEGKNVSVYEILNFTLYWFSYNAAQIDWQCGERAHCSLFLSRLLDAVLWLSWF